MQLWHVTWSAEGRLPFFPHDALRLAAVRALTEAGRVELLLFCIVDEHVHAVFHGERCIVARRVRAITRRLRRLAVVPLDSPRIRSVNGRSHLVSLIRYLVCQPAHHGLPGHPALWSGSCLPDLVGARRLSCARLGLWAVLPRQTTSDVLAVVSLGRDKLEPASRERVAAMGAHGLVRSSAAAFGVSLPLRGQSEDVMAAKRAACVMAAAAGLPLRGVATAGGFSWRTARRLASQPVEPEVTQVVRLHIALEDRARLYPFATEPQR
jgi:REP element-mobilizing transposase RayT